MGERTPHLDPDCRGVFFGLSAMHTRAHMIRAVMEGVALSLKDCATVLGEMGVTFDDMLACGGGGKSKLWRQMLADVYHRDVTTLRSSEGPALGVAILAGVGVGLYPSVEEACAQMIETKTTVSPNEADAAQMEKVYVLYQKLYTSLKEDFKSMKAL